MKINLHCHTNYSDGDDIVEMAKAHQKNGFSAFVVTDHVYPLLLAEDLRKGYSMCITSYQKFQHQTAKLEALSKELNFPCIQGIELALWGEEVLVFGHKAIKDIFELMENLDLKEQEKYVGRMAYKRKIVRKLINILKNNKEDTAVILCHPRLDPKVDWVLKPLYPLLDGYEFQNRGAYYFTDATNQNQKRRWDRPVPPELLHKKKFYNSDAHSSKSISLSEGNFHLEKITTLEELIAWIKSPKQNERELGVTNALLKQKGGIIK